MEFTVIFNPQNLLNKHEVWYKGEAVVHDAEGFAQKKQVVRKSKSFRTAEAATGYIKYQKDVAAFKGGN